ncbi:MAG TPA: uroporphyrinogen-III C-methyltransferase [Acidimicrobiales bacterium]|nr:uroporphyrinogen-III C-methyltransferase [Acidimicrobiales bacterium]
MTVHLVGAGPGDPGLLTVRALELLRRADVVVYDRLSQESLLDLAPAAAERIDVGKAPGHVRLTQSEINDLLIERGRRGEAVVRLKGGDPFVFARGGEEAAALVAAGVPFEVVPGITSAIAVPAYAGIPVTLRHSSTSVTIVTGHEEPGAEGAEGAVDWQAVARVGGTIVVLMGVARIGRIATELMAAGRSPDTPVAAVQWGTRPEQRTVRATLSTIAGQPLGTPSTIVIGDVAASDLAWYENRPLFGRRVVVTRAREQAGELVVRLQAQGAATVEVPAIEIRDPADGGAALAAAADHLGDYGWVVLTSPNGARRLLDAVRDRGRDARAFAQDRLAAIGPGTAEVLASANLVVDLVPPRFVAESLLDAFPEPPGPAGGRVLLVRAAVARDVLPEGLRAKGWDVDVVEAYRTEQAPLTEEQAAAVAAADVVTFTSSSTVTNFLAAIGARPIPPAVVAIGPITAATAREHGLAVDVEAEVHTIDGLVDALVAWAAKTPGRSAGSTPAGDTGE